ncbi:MAG: prenyltransferase/squalene oxidase repeat-containing protein [Candidatus Brocadiia bacterium]
MTLRAIACLFLAMTIALCAVAEEQSDSMVTPEIRRAIDEGLDYLASRVGPDGSVGTASSPIAVTALAGTAFLAGGYVPGKGKYGRELDKIKDYILSCVHETSGYVSSSRFGGNMYSHGFATLFLAEAYGMTPDPRVEEALRKAVKLIEQCQGDLGGWRYDPKPSESDISVTICQVMALRAARNAGIPVDQKVIEKALECVKSCQNTDGGFKYIAGQQGGSAFPRSAAGVCILYYVGDYGSSEITAGLKYIAQSLPGDQRSDISSHVWYGYYYATQAMYQAGGEYWNKWYPAVCKWVLTQRDRNGSYRDSSYGSDYATAMATIILQVPLCYLPIFSR